MITTVQLPSKPLSLFIRNNSLYVGLSHGVVYHITAPFRVPRILHKCNAPVSAIAFAGDELCFGTWDGSVHLSNSHIKLTTNIIKYILCYGDIILVSADFKLVVLSFELKILNEIEVPTKIYNMTIKDGKVLCGMGGGKMGEYYDDKFSILSTSHDGNILAVNGNLSGCVDGKVMKDRVDEVYLGNGWIRSIFNNQLFTAGKSVIFNNKVLYEHKDEIIGVVEIGNKIISFGLDCCYKIWCEDLEPSDEEELMKLL